MHQSYIKSISLTVATPIWDFRFVIFASVLMVAMMAVSGCSLGHRQFKTKDSVASSSSETCQSFSTVFKTGDGAENQLRLTDDYKKAALIPNVCVEESPNNGRGMSLAVIEFDDEGNHWSRRQFDVAMREIEEISNRMKGSGKANGEDVDESVRSEGIFLVVYVHGWRKNASENRESLGKFRWFIRELARSDETCLESSSPVEMAKGTPKVASGPQEISCTSRPHVFGVYISWRGDAVGDILSKVPGLEYLTFWNRKAAARRVAGTAVTETLLGLFNRLEEMDRDRFEARSGQNDVPLDASTAPPRSRSLVIGHSMGARILEHAFAQAFLAKRLEARRYYGKRLLDVRKDINRANLKLDESNKQLEKLDGDITEATRLLGALESSIEGISERILEKERNRSKIQVPPQDEHQLRAYAGVPTPKIDQLQLSCSTYDGSGVGRCLSGSIDLRVLGQCAATAVQCLYESYWCSINRLIPLMPEAGSPNCTGRFIDDAVLFPMQPSENEINEWSVFARDIALENGKIPQILFDYQNGQRSDHTRTDTSPTTAEILEDKRLFDKSIEVAGAMSHWVEHLKPFNFRPNSPVRWDVTEDAEVRLLDALGAAENEIGNSLDEGKRHLATMQDTWRQLYERREILREIDELKDKKDDMQIEADRLQERLRVLRVERREIKCQMKETKQELEKLADQVPFELDGALHPPANLVLLINAATEAMSAKNLIQAMCTTQSTMSTSLIEIKGLFSNIRIEDPEIRQPWLVSVTSEGDWATGAIFPMGVRLGRLVSGRASREFGGKLAHCEQDFGTYDDLAARTAGHHDLLWSHEVKQTSRECDPDMFQRTKGDGKSNELYFCVDGKEYLMRPNKEHQDAEGTRQYWVTQVPTEIIKGHSDVITPQTLELAKGLLDYTKLFISWCPKYNQDTGECQDIQNAEAENPP
ncbi:MAG: hypothetical protein OXI35_04275 [Gemmatimonadota bacterium]|nr:hypothetical protein [Gemmatimonadota bacterium]